MYEPSGMPCKVGLEEHVGERICVVCGKDLSPIEESNKDE
jgi:hypothetical protein